MSAMMSFWKAWKESAMKKAFAKTSRVNLVHFRKMLAFSLLELGASFPMSSPFNSDGKLLPHQRPHGCAGDGLLRRDCLLELHHQGEGGQQSGAKWNLMEPPVNRLAWLLGCDCALAFGFAFGLRAGYLAL